ncbi:MAG TPA: threonine--tRNA ligase [Erysipelothrix sp.]|jgi:threonyl-tRNA synthetase|nr:threonine--tRNA ligase [Erysipelothrix sp.]
MSFGIDFRKDENLSVLNHSCAHVMAQAVKRIYPHAKFWVGPVVEEGFYYDIDLGDDVISEDDLPRIEKEMKKISKENKRIVRIELSKDEAYEMFEKDEYKIDLIDRLDENEVTISAYKQGEFIDLCKGPHVESTRKVKHFKLNKVAGAYWKGDSNNKVLQRLYGFCFEDQEGLDDYLQRIEEAKERDHRKIGKELKLFNINSNVGLGLPFWLPRGATIRRLVERYITDKEIELGYDHVYTPIMANVDLYKTSGHWDHYHEDMFPPMDMGDGELLVLRPMNCPHHMEIYKQELHSYRELPIRIAELGMMHRYEKSGGLSGLQRVREMTLNDAHIFVRPDQIEEEFKRTIDLVIDVYKDFQIDDYSFRLSYRDPENKEKYFDDDEMWDKAEAMVKHALDAYGLEYEEAVGEAAFYGPKLDVQVKTAMGNEETLSTIQLDFLLPERFELTYVGEDGKNEHRPVVIHRGVVSTMERFVAYLVERYKGAFPLWLAWQQVTIIPVHTINHLDYSTEVYNRLKEVGARVEIDDRNEKLGFRLREAQMLKIPVQIVIGDREAESKSVNIRPYGSKEQLEFTLDEFIDWFTQTVKEKR